MIEETLINYLSGKLSLPVYTEEPESRPDEYVLLRLVDYSRTNFIDAVTIEAESVSTSMYKASTLSAQVRAAMLDASDLDVICSVRCSDGAQAITSTDKTYRYDVNFNINYYGD